MLAWLGGHLTVLAALIAALIGYLNFSVFAATQMVWITVVVLATSLLMKFADDLFTWLCSSDSRIGQGFAAGTGSSNRAWSRSAFCCRPSRVSACFCWG